MYRFLLTAGITTLLVLFGMQNFDHVMVSFIIGGPKSVRLCFLLCVAAGCGFLVSYVQGLMKELRLKKEIRRLLSMNRPVLQEPPQPFNGEDRAL